MGLYPGIIPTKQTEPAGATIPRKFAPLFRPARFKAFYGGRGSAKSHSMASALVLMGAMRPLRWLCCREIQKSLATSVHQLLRDKIELHNLSGAYQITREGIYGPNGTAFLFAGLRSNPDSIKSMEGLDGAWVEEADRVSQASLDLLLPTVRKTGSEIWFSWNRRNKSDPVDNLFLGGTPPPGSVVVEVNWRDNPYFRGSPLYDEMEWMKGRDRDKFLHIWEGHPLSRSEAKVFRNWRIDDLDDLIPEGTTARFGADWGFSVDPTVLIKSYRWGRTLYIPHEAYKVKCAIDETPSLFAGHDLEEPPRWVNSFGHRGVPGALGGRIVADSARPETVAYMRARGFDIKSAIKGARSVEEGVEFLQACDIVVHPRCTHTSDELATYSYKVDKMTDEILSELDDKNNHVIDALRYAHEGERRRTGGKIATFTELVTDN